MEDHDIYRVFEQVKPTRSQEEAMLERLFLEERKGRPMKLMKKTIAVLAAAALLLTTCAFAAVTGLGRQVLDYFGVRQEDEALFSQEWEPVGLSHTFQNGWTVDVNQMYTGLYSAAILVDVTAPEGVVLDGDNYSLKYWWEETDNPQEPRLPPRRQFCRRQGILSDHRSLSRGPRQSAGSGDQILPLPPDRILGGRGRDL